MLQGNDLFAFCTNLSDDDELFHSKSYIQPVSNPLATINKGEVAVTSTAHMFHSNVTLVT